MMNLKEIHESARTLASQFRGRVPMPDALQLMASVQPTHEEFWMSAVVSIEAGNPLSASLRGVWPPALVSAVIAGEASGDLESVFSRIVKTVRIQLDLRRTFMKLAYPAGIALAGVVVFINIMVFIVPMTTRAFGSKRGTGNFITEVALAMESFFTNYWMVFFGAVAGGVFLLVRWVKSEQGMSALQDMALGVPKLGDGLVELYFGLWSEYMALMFAAGIAIDRAVVLTVEVMPASLRGGFELFVNDLLINSVTLQQAVDPKRLSADDPRLQWPLFVRSALTSGHNTGEVDVEFMLIAPELVELGVTKVQTFIAIANGAAIAMAASLIGVSFMAIYLPMFAAMQGVR